MRAPRQILGVGARKDVVTDHVRVFIDHVAEPDDPVRILVDGWPPRMTTAEYELRSEELLRLMRATWPPRTPKVEDLGAD